MNDAVLIDDHADVDDEKKIDEVRINLRVKKSSHPELFDALVDIHQGGRAERMRMMAGVYLQMLGAGAWLSNMQINTQGAVPQVQANMADESSDQKQRKRSLLMSGGLDKNGYSGKVGS